MSSAPSRPWNPDVELPMAGAARLIAEQFEDLRSPVLEPIGRGWDNDAYRVNGEYVFRFPRRKIAAVCMRGEIASLPRIAESLPLEVPRITHVGNVGGTGREGRSGQTRPSEHSERSEQSERSGRSEHSDPSGPEVSASKTYPYPFAGYRWIEGRTACSVAMDDESRRRCAGPLGRFLKALHSLPVPKDAPEDPAGRKDVATLVAKSLARLETIAEWVPEAEEARATVERLSGTAEWDGRARWSHGDLYARHLLVDERGELRGVIDWGDVHAGETADDLSIAYSFLPREARPEFFEAYGPTDPASLERARLYALHCGGVLAFYGREVGDRALMEAGRLALTFAVG